MKVYTTKCNLNIIPLPGLCKYFGCFKEHFIRIYFTEWHFYYRRNIKHFIQLEIFPAVFQPRYILLGQAGLSCHLVLCHIRVLSPFSKLQSNYPVNFAAGSYMYYIYRFFFAFCLLFVVFILLDFIGFTSKT